MKQIPWKFLLVCSLFFLLASSKFPPPSVTPKEPNIANGGRAVAIAVDPGNDNNIIVASDSGGLFRSMNHGANWTQVSGSSTFWFGDITYLPSIGLIYDHPACKVTQPNACALPAPRSAAELRRENALLVL